MARKQDFFFQVSPLTSMAQLQIPSQSALQHLCCWNKEWTPYSRTVRQGSDWLGTFSKFQTTLWERWDLSPDVWFQRLCSFYPHTCHFKTAPRTCYSWQRTKVAGRLQGTPPPTGSSAFICWHRAFQGRLQQTQKKKSEKSVPTLKKDVSQFFILN